MKRNVSKKAIIIHFCPDSEWLWCSFYLDRSWCLSWSRTRGSSRPHPDSSKSTASYWRITATCRPAAWVWRANWAWSRVRTSTTASQGGWRAAHSLHLPLLFFLCSLLDCFSLWRVTGTDYKIRKPIFQRKKKIFYLTMQRIKITL